MKTKIIFASVIGIGCVGTLYLYFVEAYNSHRNENFEQVTKGMLRQDVISLMGEPDRVDDLCYIKTWPGETGVSDACEVELSFDARFKPVYWVVGFDHEDRAVSKSQLVSP